MSRLTKVLQILTLLVIASSAMAAVEAPVVSPKATPLLGDHVTNSMITGWVVSFGLILLLMKLVGKPSIIPSKGQAVVETLMAGMKELFLPIVGKKAFPTAFPLLLTFFVFILFHNWMGLLPGVGTVGWGIGENWWQLEKITKPILRPFTSEVNGTLALAIISFGAWFIIVMKYAGPRVLLFDIFGNKAEKSETPGWLYPILSIVFLVVGVIELVSIGIRPLTLSVRLYGNIFGGESLLHGTSFIFLAYFFELFVGLVQASVFTLLTAIYIGLICNHGDDHDHEEGASNAH